MPDNAVTINPVEQLAAEVARLAAAIDAQSVGQEGLSPAEAAAYLGISTAKLHQLDSAGLLPEPARLGVGNCPRWSRTELRSWMLAGAPSRPQWRSMREMQLRKIA